MVEFSFFLEDDQCLSLGRLMSDIFALIAPLFKLDNSEISKKITLILAIMTNECERS